MKDSKFDFEEAIKKLDSIAEKLENGEESLEESIHLFEEGMDLSKQCSDFLSDAEKRIKVLVEEDGKIEERDFTAE